MILAQNRLNVGWNFHRRGNLERAANIYRSVVEDFPKRSDAWTYLGMVLNDRSRYEEALSAYDRALQITPADPAAWTNRGNTLGMLGKHEQSLASHRRALEIDSAHPRAHTNLGIQLLRMGDFASGWSEYNWRLKTAMVIPPQCDIAQWRGETLAGKHLLVHGEQGLGDEIQTARFLAHVRQMDARVSLTADEKLIPLFKRSTRDLNIIPRGTTLPDADYQISAFGLAEHFGNKVKPLSLKTDPKLHRKWQSDFRRFANLRIGVSWCGNPQNPMNHARSFPLNTLLSHIDQDHVNLVSLQGMHGAEDLQRVDPKRSIERPLTDGLDQGQVGSVDEMAAIIEALDLVITCDSMCAHLAASLGVETWLLLAYVPDWRWGLSNTDSCWYDTLRLFRQTRHGEWSEIIERLGVELSDRLHPTLDGEVLESHVAEKSCRHGRFRYFKTDQYIGRSLALYGEFSEGEVQLFQRIIRSGDHVVEVGSNIGTHTIPLANLIGSEGKLSAFEPQKINFDLLNTNLRLNALTNVDSYCSAVGQEQGVIQVPQLDPRTENNFGGVGLREHNNGNQVPLVTIDSLQLPYCHLLKADVEGMEAEVLNGAKDTIGKFKPFLYLENDRKEKMAALIAQVRGLGYRVYWHFPPMFNRTNYFKNATNVFGNIHSLNILAIHQSRKIEVKGLREAT